MSHHTVMYTKPVYKIGRRAFLQSGTLFLAAGSLGATNWAFSQDSLQQDAGGTDSPVTLKIGLLTDVHHADKPPAGTRFYRESLRKLHEAAAQFKRENVSIVVELGDIVDKADSVDTELSYLTTVNQQYSRIAEDRHYVLGNHCVDTLTKAEFLETVGREQSYYSFDRGDYHFIVLDACFRTDGVPYGRQNSMWNDANIPSEELHWLRSDLQSTDKPTVIFAHQRLDVDGDLAVKNHAAVRDVLESSNKVRVVFQGHSHENDLKEMGGIHYCTLAAMVEGSGVDSNGYSVMNIHDNGLIRVDGFRRQLSHRWNG
jgi:predicted phosphodiesterase